MERFPISYASSGKDLVRWMLGGGRKTKGLLALGDPDYKSKTVVNTAKLWGERGVYLEKTAQCLERNWIKNPASLPGTYQEAKKVFSHYQQSGEGGKVSLLLGKKATESQVKLIMHEFAYIHMATHGFFFSGECGGTPVDSQTRGGGFFRPEGPAAAVVPAGESENPLLLSGLLLAGAAEDRPSGSDDGVLTAAEVINLDLSGVRLAVLSACETGRGKEHSGEGVMGLRSAFILAEAKGLMLSLWKVPDDETQAMMADIYSRLFKKKEHPASALRASMLAALKKRGFASHPAAWAAFTFTGLP